MRYWELKNKPTLEPSKLVDQVKGPNQRSNNAE